MFKRIFLVFLSVLMIITFSSCKTEREFYQGEQTTYIQCSNGILLDVSKMVKYPYDAWSLRNFNPPDPYPTPSIDQLESVRDRETGVILLVTVDEHPEFVMYKEGTEGNFVLETTLRVNEIFFQGKGISVKENDILVQKSIQNSITVFVEDAGPLGEYVYPHELSAEDAEGLSWTLCYPYIRHGYEDGSRIKRTIPLLRKGYSYIVYGTIKDGEFNKNSNYALIEVSTPEDHAKYYENIGLEDPEYPEISAQVLDKYWYH